MCLVDRAEVLFDCGVAPGGIGGWEIAAATQAGDGQIMSSDGLCGGLDAHLAQLFAPGRDATDAVARATGYRLGQAPLFAYGCSVE